MAAQTRRTADPKGNITTSTTNVCELCGETKGHSNHAGMGIVKGKTYKDGEYDEGVAELVVRIKQAVKEARADGTVAMSKGNLKQVVNTRGLRFANANVFERAFEEAVGKAGVSSFVR